MGADSPRGFDSEGFVLFGFPLIHPFSGYQKLGRHSNFISFSVAEVQVRIAAGFSGLEEIVSGTGRYGIPLVQWGWGQFRQFLVIYMTLVAQWCSGDCCRDRITRLALQLLLLEGKVPEFAAQEAGHCNT